MVVKGVTILCVLIISGYSTSAQQLGQYTQYFSNELVINPAFAGVNEALSITLVHRSQWTGLEGAPSTQTISGHSLFKNEHIGLGASIINDKIGIHQNLTFNTSYAYHLQVKPDAFLSMGLQLGMNYKQSDYGSIAGQVQNPGDPSISEFKETTTSLEVGTGLYYRDSRLHIGLSAPKLFSSKTKLNDSVSINLNKAHYFLYSRYRLPVSHNIKIQPGILVKYLPGVPVSFDFHFAAIFNEVLLTGLSYRSFESVDLVLQAKITPQLKAGYNFDYPIGKVGELNHSSHEIMLNYLFKYSRYRKRPR